MIAFRPNLIGEFRVGYLRNHKDSVPTSFAFDLSKLDFEPSVVADARAGFSRWISTTVMPKI